MTEEASTLAAAVESLRTLGVARAVTWFDDYWWTYAFAVSFRDGSATRAELEPGLTALTRAALEKAAPDYDPAFHGGQLVVDVAEGTVAVELARVATEARDAQLTVDLTSAASLFERSPEPDADEDEAPTAWDLEWHVADSADEDRAGELAKLEAVFTEATEDPATSREWLGAIESLLDAVDEEDDPEDDDEALDPDEAIGILDEALAALRAAGAATAAVRYEEEEFGQALADAMNAVAGQIESEKDDPAAVVASTYGAVQGLLEESPWQLVRLELDGRVLTETEPAVAWLRTAATLVLMARLGEWEEVWSTSGSSGVLRIDLLAATATIAHSYSELRRLPPERIVIQARDGG